MSLCTSKVSTSKVSDCICTLHFYMYTVLSSQYIQYSSCTRLQCTCTTVRVDVATSTVLHYSFLNFKGNMTSDFRERERVNIDSIEYWVLSIEYWLLSNDCKIITITSYFLCAENIKSKHRCFLSDESLESLLICAVSEIEPRFIQIIESSEFRISNEWINLI